MSPFSEPETRNVKWLMDNFPTLALFLDLHSYAGDVLFNWGNDENQTSDPSQTFTNPAFDGMRGGIGDFYAEYIDSWDLSTAKDVAQTVSDAMKAVQNHPYKPLQAVGLYPTSGASDDYAFSRHFASAKLPTTYGFTLEFNFDTDGFLATANPDKLDATMVDVIPGLIALCLSVPESGFLPDVSEIDVRALALKIIYLNQATGEIWYIGGDGKIHKKPGPPDPYRSAMANEIVRLLNAYDALESIAGPAGESARQGILRGIQKIAGQAVRPGG